MIGTLQPRYISLDDLRDYVASTSAIGTATDGLLTDSILRAESAIDDYTRRNFVGTAGTYYVSRYEQRRVVNHALYLDQDLHTLISLTNGDTQVIPVGSVWVEPRNSGPPYRILRLKSSYVYVWNTDSDVIIAGTWGFSTVPPAAIQQACVRLAAQYYRLKDVGITGVAGESSMGEVQYPPGIPEDVKIILNPYRSRSGGAV